MKVSQTNTQPDACVLNSAVALTGLEGRLVKLADGGSIPEVDLPGAVTDLALLIVTEGGALDEPSEVISLLCEGNRRVRLNGTVSAGVPVVLCDPTASAGVNAGKVETLPATAGAYFSPGVAEEDGVDEQLVLIRPMPRIIVVPATFSGATPAATAATSSTPFGFSQAQADALIANVREIRAALVAQRIMLPNA
jgi:hypothetical protein